MPTYQYSCTECGHFLEQFQSFSDDALTECPVCGGKLRKVFNAVGVVFKGSGFYRNDSRSTSSGAGSESGTGSGSESGTGGGGSSSTSSKESSTTESSSTSKKESSSTSSTSPSASKDSSSTS